MSHGHSIPSLFPPKCCSDAAVMSLADFDEHSVNATIVTDMWDRIPKVSPKSVNELSLTEKLAVLEGKFGVFENSLSSLRSDMILNNYVVTKSITSLEYESKTHGKLIDQMMSQKEQDPGVIAIPTMAQVVSSGREFPSQVLNQVIITPAPSTSLRPTMLVFRGLCQLPMPIS